MFSIPLFKVFMSSDAVAAVQETMLSGWLTQGPKVKRLEQTIANYLQYEPLVAVNSGTSALHLGLRLSGVQPGDEVISTPLTCIATNIPIMNTYAKIVWADVDPNTCNVCLEDICDKVSSKTKAIMVVHWGGIPVDIVRLKRLITEKHGFCPPIIEDCAHSLGATYKDGKGFVGSSGNYCAFSLQAIKHLTTADGGLLTVPRSDYDRARCLRFFGIDRDNKENQDKDFPAEIPVSEWGYKYNMNDLTATIGIHNFSYFRGFILPSHRENASYYNSKLSRIDGIKLFDVPYQSDPAYWLYTIKVENRRGFMDYLNSKGIAVNPVHRRNDLQPCFQQFKTDLPGLDSMDDKYVCLPVGWWVRKEDREYITDCIEQGW